MLKDKQFWDEIEDIVNDEHSDYVVLDLYFAMRTYIVLTINLSQLPVDEDKFNNIFDICREKALNILKGNYSEYTTELQNIVKAVPEVGVASSVLKVIDFIRNHKELFVLFCAMGVLNGIEDCTTDTSSLCVLRAAKNALFDLIVKL